MKIKISSIKEAYDNKFYISNDFDDKNAIISRKNGELIKRYPDNLRNMIISDEDIKYIETCIIQYVAEEDDDKINIWNYSICTEDWRKLLDIKRARKICQLLNKLTPDNKLSMINIIEQTYQFIDDVEDIEFESDNMINIICLFEKLILYGDSSIIEELHKLIYFNGTNEKYQFVNDDKYESELYE